MLAKAPFVGSAVPWPYRLIRLSSPLGAFLREGTVLSNRGALPRDAVFMAANLVFFYWRSIALVMLLRLSIGLSFFREVHGGM